MAERREREGERREREEKVWDLSQRLQDAEEKLAQTEALVRICTMYFCTETVVKCVKCVKRERIC